MFCASQFLCLAQNNLSSFEDRTICGFSEDNVIFSSRDGGSSWSECDFNKVYQGYYRPVSFVSIAAGANSMAIVGVSQDGKTHMYISSDGKNWAERELTWLEHGSPMALTAKPVGLQFDSERDQFLLHCSDSTTLILPPCSHCNQLLPTSDALLLIKKD